MNVVVLGATGFIGSHVAEQMKAAGHTVIALTRANSDISFLRSIGVECKSIAFTRALLGLAFKAGDVVVNCTARPHPNLGLEEHRKVEVHLARDIAEACAEVGVARLLQLSTIQVHGSRTPRMSMNEASPRRADAAFQQAYIEREDVVREVAARTGLDVVIFRPASTIGVRDQASFFSMLYFAYLGGQFPLVDSGDGGARVALIDTRDLGRAMEWLARLPQAAGQTYLAKGYDVRWGDIKAAFDRSLGPIPQKKLPPVWALNLLANVFEATTKPPKVPPLAKFMVLALTHDVLIDDSKLRATGFAPDYGFDDSVREALSDLKGRTAAARIPA